MYRAALAGLLLLLFCASAWEAWKLGPTVDEPSHIVSSWLYWHGRDRLYPRDMPPMIKIVGGSVLSHLDLRVPPDLGKPGDRRQEWVEAGAIFSLIPADRLRSVLFAARLPLVIFPLVVAALLFRWSSELFSPAVGLCVAAMWVFCPTALGHSGIFKNDLAATATHLCLWYSAWRFWRKPTSLMAVAVGAAAALALISKLSLLTFTTIVPIILAARAVTRRRFGLAVLWPVLGVASLWLVAAAAWQFELHWTSPTELAELAKDRSIPASFIAAAQVFRVVPVPEGAWTGVVSLLKSNSDPMSVYMLGQIYPEGNRAYFLLATILKMAVPTLLLFCAGVVFAFRRRLRVEDIFWLAPGFVYFGLASLSSLHFGIRLVLPAWAFFFLVAGVAVEHLLQSRNGRILMAGSLAGVAVLSLRVYPYGIAYFNPWAGDPPNALKYLADSNIDWGQSLGAAAEYVRRHGIRDISLSYFGYDNPSRYLQGVNVRLIAPPWDGKAKTERLQPQPGWYVISANLLPGQLFTSNYRDYYAEFRERTPVAVAGGSMFIYRID